MINEPVPPPVVARVRAARSHLMDAQFRLDDFGYSCRLLDRLQDAATSLLAEWAGRTRPDIEPRAAMPPHVAEAAKEYRRVARRSY